jgi:hypothetical protein
LQQTLYADDLVLISDNQLSLQQKLDLLNKYCQELCLEIDVNKTKIIIFNKRGQLIKEKITINDIDIDIQIPRYNTIKF